MVKAPIEYRRDDGEVFGNKYKPGTSFHYAITYPVTNEPCALVIEHDGENTAEITAMARLYDEKLAPPCVHIGVRPGTLTFESGVFRRMRCDNYDLFNAEYGDFLVYELIPALTEKYGLTISPDPDYHMTAGCSSGGISAFVAAWFHPDYFHRIYMSSPSFVAMGRGNEIPNLIRKYETKPFRIYEEYSQDEPNEYFGSSFCAAREAEMAFEYAGYDFTSRYFPGEEHGSRHRDEGSAYERMKWIWADYAEKPIRAARNSPRVDEVIPPDSRWERADVFPKAEPTRAVDSSDRQMRYFGSEDREELWKYPLRTNGEPDESKRYCHGFLHTLPGVYPKGALDLDADECDHLYVLTMMGIQCVRSFGLIDVILALPEGEMPEMIAIVGRTLWLKTDRGVWKRSLTHGERKAEGSEPHFVFYYDN